MIKKKTLDIGKIMLWGGIPSAIIAIFGFIIASSKTITVYADLPKEVEEVKGDVGDVKEYIKEQRMSNELMQKIVEKKDERIISEDGKRYWDADTQAWRKI